MNNEDVSNTDAKPSPVTNDKSPKLPYAPPKLKEYGDIRELTLGGLVSSTTDTITISTVTG